MDTLVLAMSPYLSQTFAQGQQQYLKTRYPVLGLNPRDFGAGLAQVVKGEYAQGWSYCLAKAREWFPCSIEHQFAACALLALFALDGQTGVLALTVDLLRLVDTWTLSDPLALFVLGPWVKRFPEEWPNLVALSADPVIWVRRAPLVCTAYVNGGVVGGPIVRVIEAIRSLPRERPLPRTVDTLALVTRYLHESDPIVQKAMAWALRELGAVSPKEVVAFVEEHRSRLPRPVITEALKKTQRRRG